MIIDFILTLFSTFVRTLLFPFRAVFGIAYYVYRIIFFIQLFLSGQCEQIFGDGYGCRILNPDYIFTSVIKQLLLLSLIGYLAYLIYQYYASWQKSIISELNKGDCDDEEE